MSDHSEISPSMFHRIRQCPGSVQASRGIPEPEAGEAAVRGTRIHEMAEEMLNCGFVADVSGIDHRDLDLCSAYAKYVRDIAHNYSDPQILVEQRVELGDWIPGGKGSCDAIVISQSAREMHIIDLKTGSNPVSADCDQLWLYALGALDTVRCNANQIYLTIYQPGNINRHGPITPTELYDFGLDVRRVAAEALSPNPPLRPSESACQYCRAAPTCPALHNQNLATVGGDFDQLPAVDALTEEQLATVILRKAEVEKWLRAVWKHGVDKAREGHPIRGTKLVEGRATRRWKADAAEALYDVIGDEAFEKKLIGVTAADKLAGKDIVDALTEKHGSPTLVGEDDPRPALGNVADDFD